MKCPVCKMEIKEFDKKIDCHLIVSKDTENHIHVHGDLDKKENMKELLEVAQEKTEVLFHKKELNRKEIVFKNRQRIGDILMFTCAVRDFKRQFPDVTVGVSSTVMHIWDYNPYVHRLLHPTPENVVEIGPGKLTNASNRLDWHFANGFRLSIESALGVHIEQGVSRPDIWLTQEEYDAPRFIKEPYWIICVGGEKGWGCKMYPFERFQEFVNQNKDVKFVQIGSKGDNHKILQGDNVINHIGKTENKDTGVRDLFKLFLNAEGSIGLVSFHTHLSAALYKPAIIIAGAREPVSFTKYPGHQYLATDGCLPCATTACWKCDINACKTLVTINNEKVPKCVDLIRADDLTRALDYYYEGGRLNKKAPSAKPMQFKNIVPTPKQPVKIDVKTKYDMEWGGGCITDKDWDFIDSFVQKYSIKKVLEFGTGLSTLLFKEKNLSVISYETIQSWINTVVSKNKDCNIKLWDGKNQSLIEKQKFDLAFVDGPAGGANRETSTKLAAELADIVIVHDANREYEKQWQEKYLKDSFSGPIKGGHRCHAWVKKEKQCPIELVVTPKNNIIKPDKKYIKFVSTARGWGGCARSITTIMKNLLKEGHSVEFIPFRNNVSSSEFKNYISDYLECLSVTTNYATLSESCDILFMYADDYIWEFGNKEISDVFSNVNAEKKIMMLNFRRGKVGEIPWTRNWDKYMFLNSTQERELLKVHPGVKTKVLPPCTELEEFFKVNINYKDVIRLVRHSSQGDTKFDKDFKTEVENILGWSSNVELHFLPGPSYIQADNNRIFKYPRTDKVTTIAEFLSKGNLFWYSLPKGYMDMGPRVVLEAMACGLPVLADNWGGVVDRITPECGWLCDTKADHVSVLMNLELAELERKGKAARERARAEFVPEKWIEEIIT